MVSPTPARRRANCSGVARRASNDWTAITADAGETRWATRSARSTGRQTTCSPQQALPAKGSQSAGWSTWLCAMCSWSSPFPISVPRGGRCHARNRVTVMAVTQAKGPARRARPKENWAEIASSPASRSGRRRTPRQRRSPARADCRCPSWRWWNHRYCRCPDRECGRSICPCRASC